jgi:hypothetical protein
LGQTFGRWGFGKWRRRREAVLQIDHNMSRARWAQTVEHAQASTAFGDTLDRGGIYGGLVQDNLPLPKK